MIELKPCPFCGNDKLPGVVNDEWSAYVQCWRCGARGPVISDHNEEHAVKWWNMRRGEKDG